MRHDFYDPRYEEPKEKAPKTLSGRFSYQWENNHGVRKCRRCGLRQVKLVEHEWMRVAGYKWYPESDGRKRCPGGGARGRNKHDSD